MDKLKVIEAKRLRALIIKACYDAYPGSLLKGTIKRAFSGNYSNLEVDKAIEYLKGSGKEYITESDADGSVDEEILIKLTSKGVDLMDETIEDPGVGF